MNRRDAIKAGIGTVAAAAGVPMLDEDLRFPHLGSIGCQFTVEQWDKLCAWMSKIMKADKTGETTRAVVNFIHSAHFADMIPKTRLKPIRQAMIDGAGRKST